MERRVEGWVSPRTGREMPVACYGHFGQPLILFPTATADYLEYERFQLVEAMRPLLEAGVVKLYSVESPNRWAWMNPRVPPWEAVHAQNAYNGYVTEELVPFVRDDCRAPGIRIAASGASFGCYHAANQLFRRPDLFNALIGMSGGFDLKPWTRGYFDADCYFNSPIDYVPGLSGEALKTLKKQCRIVMVTGRARDENPRSVRRFARVLRAKQIKYKADYWGKDVRHDWVWWRRMLPYWTARLFA